MPSLRFTKLNMTKKAASKPVVKAGKRKAAPKKAAKITAKVKRKAVVKEPVKVTTKGKRRKSLKLVAPPIMGRPTTYTPELAAAIVDWIYQDYTLRQICALPNMPDKSTIMRWLAKHDDFCDHYARAHEVRAFSLEEEVNEIADDSSNDWMAREFKDGHIEMVPNEEVISRSKLRIETKKWLMSIKAPKRYGKSVALTGPKGEGAALTVTFEQMFDQIEGAGTGLPPHASHE